MRIKEENFNLVVILNNERKEINMESIKSYINSNQNMLIELSDEF